MLLSQLNYFKIVASHEHISHAAEELHIAQPALSVTISKIEKELDTPLFNRNGRNIELNEDGKRLLMYVDFLFNQLQEMENSLAQIKEVWENECILAVNNSTFLSGWLQQFLKRNPTIRLQQKMMSEEQMVAALIDESIDIALGEFKENFHEEIECKELIDDEYIITIPINHTLADKEKIYFEDICNEDIIALSSSAVVRVVDRVFAQMRCQPNIVFEGNQRTMAKMVRSNKGLLFDSRQMVYMNYLRSKEDSGNRLKNGYHVKLQAIVDVDSKYKLSLCYKKGRKLPLAVQKFINAMEQEYPSYQKDEDYIKTADLYLTIS